MKTQPSRQSTVSEINSEGVARLLPLGLRGVFPVGQDLQSSTELIQFALSGKVRENRVCP